MIEKVMHTAAWRGDELFRREDFCYRLTVRDIEELETALALVNQRGIPLTSISPESFPLPSFSKKLNAMQHGLEHGSGAVFLRGLPVERYTLEDATRLFWGLGRYIGTPVSQSASGERVFHVRDEGFQVGHPKARGPNTKKKLHFHTDRCDVIAFMCINQAKQGGENFLVSSVTVHNEMLARRPDLLKILYQPFYYKRHNVDTGNWRPYCRQPIFARQEGHFVANVLRVLIERGHQLPDVPDLTREQREALDYLDTVAEDERLNVRFRQEPGDMLFVNNFVVFHSRTEFDDYPEPERKRLLLRLWLSVPNSRPLPPAFAAHYGSTEAGAIRGGMHAQS